MDAILSCDDLAYHFPSSDEQIQQVANEFKKQSTRGVLDGCVGCLDGFLLQIRTPSARETGHVKSYFSGHYRMYGVNIQAVCDSQCRFTYVSVAAPGGTNDIVAFRKTTLHNIVEELPLGKYIIADNAYICTEHILTPFPGEQKQESKKDAYNFYLSQLQIRIEMTFGCLVNKWSIFRRPLQVKLENVGRVFMCATRLHNFFINEGGGDDTIFDNTSHDLTEIALVTPSENCPTSVPNNSIMREIVMEEISQMGLLRPLHTI